MLFYVDAEAFHRALAKFPDTEKSLREKSGISEAVWYSAKNGTRPFLPRTIAKFALLLEVQPETLIRCSTEDMRGEAVKLA